MTKKINLDDLSLRDLQKLLVEKRRAERSKRLAHYRKTGRVVRIQEDRPVQALDQAISQPIDSETVVEKKPRSKFLDRLLILVEIAAVAGLLYILFMGSTLLQNLNQEVSSALIQPTLTETPLIMAVVLPSGHTPPTSSQAAQPNDAEIPEHLRPMVQSIADIPVPTPGPQQAVRIQIPAIRVDAPIVQGDSWEQLKKGVGLNLNSPIPGDNGNIVLSAHNDIFGEIFRDLDQLENGDEIIIFTSQQTYTYVVTETFIVEPTQVEVMAATTDPVVTLISCYPYLVDDQRIIVKALLQ